jgi:hypothetical protein
MNFYERTVGTPYLRWKEILPVLEQFKIEGYVFFLLEMHSDLIMRSSFMSDI